MSGLTREAIVIDTYPTRSPLLSTTPSYPTPEEPSAPFLSSLLNPVPSPFLSPEPFKMLPLPESPVPMVMIPSLPSHRHSSSAGLQPPPPQNEGKGKDILP